LKSIGDKEQLVLVVERQHLERHDAQRRETGRERRERRHAREHAPEHGSRTEQRRHERPVHAIEQRRAQPIRIVLGVMCCLLTR
jgi:hypothetical protein